PIDEEEAFVVLFGGRGASAGRGMARFLERRYGPQWCDGTRPRTILDLVLGDVDVDERAVATGESRAAAVNDGEACTVLLGSAQRYRRQRFAVEQVCQPAWVALAEDLIVPTEVRAEQVLELVCRQQCGAHVEPRAAHAPASQGGAEAHTQLVPQDAAMTIENHGPGRGKRCRQGIEAGLDGAVYQFERRVEVVLPAFDRRLPCRQEPLIGLAEPRGGGRVHLGFTYTHAHEARPVEVGVGEHPGDVGRVHVVADQQCAV